MPFLLVVLALIMLVVVHELGHFLAARAVGVRATKFYLFFPPAVFKKQIGDVEYGVGAIPAGGFVKLPGMFEPDPGEVAERLRWEFETALPLVTDADARLHVDAARRRIAHAEGPDDLAAPLEEIRDGFAAARDAAGVPDEDRRVLAKAHDRVVGLLDDAHPKAYWRAPLWRRMTVIAAGPAVNLLVAFVMLTGFYWFLVPKTQLDGPLRVGAVVAGSPAAIAGLEKGDEIVEWNGPVAGADTAEFFDDQFAIDGKPLHIAWMSGDGERSSATLIPAVLGGTDSKEPRVGINLDEVRTEIVGRHVTGPGTGVRAAWADISYITKENLTRLPQVFFKKEVREDVGSVVGIVQVADDVDRAGQFVRYVGIISLILAVMNLLPLLPLDGGHLLFGVLEALRRKPMPRALFERYSMVGMALVLILFFIGLDNDIGRARG